MEARRFDALVRAAQHAGSRRGLLGGLAVLALAPLTTLAKPQPAACLPVGKRCSQVASGAGHAKRTRKGKHKPPACRTCCSRFGAADADGTARCTCKGEGVSCDNASQCCGGQCKSGRCTGCPGDTVFCTDGCADLQTNTQHCGSCDIACAVGQRCVNGSCTCDATSCPTGCCDLNQQCQRGTSVNACGDNGSPCDICLAGETCEGDTCVCASGVICSASGCCASDKAVCDQNDACCTPDCTGKVCGDDGCGGLCPGDCAANQECVHGRCCKTTCAAGECGAIADGCGGTLACGCPECQTCSAGQCVIDPDRICGDCGPPCDPDAEPGCERGRCRDGICGLPGFCGNR